MAGRDGKGELFSPGSRKRDRTIDDALKTMERLATWLDEARQQDVWQQVDSAFQAAMLHGMLVHLRHEIEALLALGGPELEEIARTMRTLAAQESINEPAATKQADETKEEQWLGQQS
jgi:hypothetical protein